MTPAEIKIDLAADVLFDFDKASIKKEAEPSLQNLATVLKANPGAAVTIEGQDGRTRDWRQVTDFGDHATFIARRVSWFSDGRSILAAVGEGDADVVNGLIARP